MINFHQNTNFSQFVNEIKVITTKNSKLVEYLKDFFKVIVDFYKLKISANTLNRYTLLYADFNKGNEFSKCFIFFDMSRLFMTTLFISAFQNYPFTAILSITILTIIF